MSFNPFPTPAALALGVVAATPVAGFALVNGTPTIITWTAPNDGQQHRVIVVVSAVISLATTGGKIGWTFTNPGGGNQAGVQLVAGGQAAASYHAMDAAVVQAGQAVSVTQVNALTAGTETCWAELWAA